MVSYLNMFHEKIPDFVSFLLFGSTLNIKLRSLDLKIHWNTLIFFDKKKYGDIVSDLNISHGKMFDFVSFPLFRFTLAMKLRNFDFESQ